MQTTEAAQALSCRTVYLQTRERSRGVLRAPKHLAIESQGAQRGSEGEVGRSKEIGQSYLVRVNSLEQTLV